MDCQVASKESYGSTSSRIHLEEQEYLSPGLQEVALLSQLVIREGHGCWLTDMDGRQYLDFMAGVAVCSLGHSTQNTSGRSKNSWTK